MCNKKLLSFVILHGLLSFIEAGTCPTFIEQKWKRISKFTCNNNCITTDGENSSTTVYGTEIYSPESFVCQAALHAGVIRIKSNQSVEFEEVEYKDDFYGTVSNRIISKSIVNGRSAHGFTFKTAKFVLKRFKEEINDVIVVHNSYNRILSSGDLPFWITCLSERDRNKNDPLQLLRWNYKDQPDFKKTAPHITDRRIHFHYIDFNLRIFICKGQTAFTDVTAVIAKSTDHYQTKDITIRGIFGRPLNIEFKKGNTNKKTFSRRFPDKWNYTSGTLPNFNASYIDKLEPRHTGSYIVGSTRGGRFNKKELEEGGYGSYHQIIGRKCEEDFFGKSCDQKCGCQNDGICHPDMGLCICKPGFRGKNCTKRCKLDYFGSECQFRCNNEDLGQGVNGKKTDCSGLIFCLPAPYGCSCAFGYSGRFCEFTNLTLPKFKTFPRISIDAANSQKLKIDSWNASAILGETYGYNISQYKLSLKFTNRQGDSCSISHTLEKVNKDECNLQSYMWNDYISTIRISIHLQQDAHRNDPPFLESQFINPCYSYNEDQHYPKLEPSHNSLRVSFDVPKIKIGNKNSCFFKWRIVGGNVIGTNENDVKGQETSCSDEINGLESGTPYSLDMWCKNDIVECEKQNFEFYTLLDNLNLVKNGLEVHFTVPKAIDVQSIFTVMNNKTTWQNLKERLPLNSTKIFKLKDISPLFEVFSLSHEKWEEKQRNDQTMMILKKEDFPGEFSIIIQYKVRGRKEFFTASEYSLTAKPGEPTNLGLVIGLTVFFLILGLLLIFWIVKRKMKVPFGNQVSLMGGFFRKRQSRAASSHQILNLSTNAVRPETNLNIEKNALPRTILNPQKTKMIPKPRQSIAIKEQECDQASEHQYVNVDDSLATNLDDIEKQFNGLIYSSKALKDFTSIPKNYGKPMDISQQRENIAKNRYKNNLPYDDTRVVLNIDENNSHSDYINASHVKSFYENKWYIACQGPKDKRQDTRRDFWKMIIENDIYFIVMVANFVENGMTKVGKYFDIDQPLELADITVEVTETSHYPHYNRTIIQIRQSKETRTVIHHQFLKWPDHGTPTEVYPVCLMMKSILQDHTQGGMVVHCSAGIGRTGSILMTILMKEMLELSGNVDPLYLLTHLREARPRLVENIIQYNFAMRMFHFLLFEEKGLVVSTEFEDDFDQYIKKSRILFKEAQLQPFNLPYSEGENFKNASYNRNASLLPSSNRLVSFDATQNVGYINAIYLDIEDSKNCVIVTEHPKLSTLNRFWKLAAYKQCSALILVQDIEAEKDYPSISSVGETVAVSDDFSVKFSDLKCNDNEAIWAHQVTIEMEGFRHTLNMYQVKNWKETHQCPSDISTLKNLIDVVNAQASESSPIMISCKDGVTGCGLVALGCSVLRHLELYQEINVYNSLIELRRQRPQFIVSHEQFECVYKVIRMYLNDNDLYQNFG